MREEILLDWIKQGRLKSGQDLVLRTCVPGGQQWVAVNPREAGEAVMAAPGAQPVAAVARDQLVLPKVALRLSPVGEQLVGLPTWLWIEPASWAPVSKTVSVPGAAITATATPQSVTWATGDGASVVCPGPGTPYSSTSPPEAASPDCGHTYRALSPPGGFSLAATVTWDVQWAGAGKSGVFPGLESTAAVTVTVVDAPAVNIRPAGPR